MRNAKLSKDSNVTKNHCKGFILQIDHDLVQLSSWTSIFLSNELEIMF